MRFSRPTLRWAERNGRALRKLPESTVQTVHMGDSQGVDSTLEVGWHGMAWRGVGKVGLGVRMRGSMRSYVLVRVRTWGRVWGPTATASSAQRSSHEANGSRRGLCNGSGPKIHCTLCHQSLLREMKKLIQMDAHKQWHSEERRSLWQDQGLHAHPGAQLSLAVSAWHRSRAGQLSTAQQPRGRWQQGWSMMPQRKAAVHCVACQYQGKKQKHTCRVTSRGT